MFPEYRDLITKLKTTDHHFTRLFDQHNALDQKITNMENHVEQGTPVEIENLKKEKLLLKDQLYAILKKPLPSSNQKQ
ncbi:MAG: YdcH family protein [Burkholderiaceae bacterium]|nr:MAG: YdcH family protein [Burkholderiaceae bacterium]